MQIKTKYSIGNFVYVNTDPNQNHFLITGILIRPDSILYYLTYDSSEILVYEMEITLDKNELIRLI